MRGREGSQKEVKGGLRDAKEKQSSYIGIILATLFKIINGRPSSVQKKQKRRIIERIIIIKKVGKKEKKEKSNYETFGESFYYSPSNPRYLTYVTTLHTNVSDDKHRGWHRGHCTTLYQTLRILESQTHWKERTNSGVPRIQEKIMIMMMMMLKIIKKKKVYLTYLFTERLAFTFAIFLFSFRII